MNIRYQAEKTFSEYLNTRGLEFIYQPHDERLWSECRYRPDFYVPSSDTFYEVVGSRQAYHENKRKYSVAATLVNLEIVRPDGTRYISNEEKRLNRPDKLAHSRLNLELFFDRHSEISKTSLAKALGFNYRHLYYIKDLSRFRCSDAKINNVSGTYPDIYEYIVS